MLGKVRIEVDAHTDGRDCVWEQELELIYIAKEAEEREAGIHDAAYTRQTELLYQHSGVSAPGIVNMAS
jgi:hypothetical protein